MNQRVTRIGLILLGLVLISASIVGTGSLLAVFYGVAAGAIGVLSLYLAVRAIGEHKDERSRGVTLTLMALMFKLPVLMITGFLASKGGIVAMVFYVLVVTMVYSLTVWRASLGELFTRSKS